MFGSRYGNLPGTCLVPALISPQLEMKSRPHSVPPLAASFRNPDPGERHASNGFMELSGSGRDKGPGTVRVLAAHGWLLRRMPFEIAFQTCDQIRFGLAGSAEDLHSTRALQLSIFSAFASCKRPEMAERPLGPPCCRAPPQQNSTRLHPSPPCLLGLVRRPKSQGETFQTGPGSLFYIHTVSSAERGKTDADEKGVDDNQRDVRRPERVDHGC